ncbi:hypothetical protein BRD00_15205 [Halobacteriales archaeon QS_8_69_26]|nr:MAG: hypothetical protein BRD00_15205 [Halobacteriales archaeon QS_8_69_26]
MDEKRELSSVDLAALVGELGAYEGAKVDKAYLYPPDLVRLKLRDPDRGRAELLIEVGDRKRAGVVSPDRVPDAPERPPAFAKMLRNRIAGGEFAGVEQYGFDRILQFHFERPDGDTTIVAELFGDGNVAALDGDRVVVDCLETVRLKSRTVVPGSAYEFPASRVTPMALDYEAFAAEMEDSDTDLVRTLATQLNLGGLWAEELCTRAGVEKTRSISEADEADYEALYDAVGRLATDLREANLDPRIYFEPGDGENRGGADADDPDDGGGSDADDPDDGGGSDADDPDDGGGSDDSDGAGGPDGTPEGHPVDVAPFALAERSDLPATAHETFDGAVEEYFHLLDEADEEPDTARDRPDFEAEIAKRERIIEQQEGAIEDFQQQAERERERAELLYANYGLVDEVLSTVRSARDEGVPWAEIEERFEEGKDRGIAAAEAVVGVDDREGTVTLDVEGTRVELDPTEGVEHNADRLYREAKRIEEKRDGALEAVQETREELDEIRERRDRWDADDGDEDGEDEEDDEFADRDWLSEPSIPVRRDEKWYERFRWFRTSDGFLVLGGRDADDNEELVKKYMESGDLFFHTDAHGAPVTVLKAADPSESARDVTVPERSREEAAQFAVSYSSVWKEGKYSGDVYMARPDQVTKTPESGEYLAKGGFAVRGDRTYYEDTPVGVAVGITCRPDTRVIGGPPDPVEERAVTAVRVEPGRYAQADVGKRIYREFRERFADTGFVRKVASPDRIQHFLPPGGSRMVGDGD